MEKSVMNRLDRWKLRIFDFVLFILFLVAVLKLLYYEAFK